MTVMFYMNDKGEVLSNKEHPVTGPLLMRPKIPRLSVLDWEREPDAVQIEVEVFKAYQVTFGE